MPQTGEKSYSLQEIPSGLFFCSIISESGQGAGLNLGHRGEVTVIAERLGFNDLASITLMINPDTENKKEIRALPNEEKQLSFRFDSREMADGTHNIVLKRINSEGNAVFSKPLEIVIDNKPPRIVRFDSVARISEEEWAIYWAKNNRRGTNYHNR